MKTIIKIIFCAVILPMLLGGSCEKLIPHWYAIDVENRSSQTIYYYAAYILPDTLLPVNKPDWLKKVGTRQRRLFYDREVGDLKFKRLSNGERITLFILDEKVVNTCEWGYIRENNLILKRYEFNGDECNKMNAVVTYPYDYNFE